MASKLAIANEEKAREHAEKERLQTEKKALLAKLKVIDIDLSNL